jgi:hypothetical protein
MYQKEGVRMSLKSVMAGAAIGFGIAALSASLAQAATVLTFEGLKDQEAIANYYNGGLGGGGSGPGPNFGITFGPDSLALIQSSDGGSGNFTNPPSGDTVAFFLSGPGDVMDVAAGFKTGFSFFYADQVGFTGSVSVYSGLDGTGALLASLLLPSTPNPYNVFVPIGVAFLGTAESVIFGGSADFIAFDDITLGSVNPGGGVPEPATWAMLLLGFVGVGMMYGRTSRKTAIA